jgi:hypothetical protein
VCPTAPGSRASGTVALAAVLLLSAVSLAGCLDKPKIEDRWTRVDVVSTSVTPGQTLPAGATQSFTLRTTVTYRAVLTGFAVAELRASDSLGAVAMTVAPDAPRVPMAQSIDDILQHSRSLGRATRAVTGWDHLVQPIDFTFSATTPPAPGSRLFLLCYLGSGMRLELPSGADSIVVTPFISSEREVLPVGLELLVSQSAP